MLLPSRALRVSVATVAAAAAVTLGLAGCGSDDSGDAAGTSTPSTSAVATTTAAASTTAGAAAADAPSAAELQGTLTTLADPAVPTPEKTALIVDGERRAAAIDQLTQALAGYGTLTFAVDQVTVAGTTATGQTVITSPNGSAPAIPLTWENVDGTWKLTDATACTLLGFAQIPCS